MVEMIGLATMSALVWLLAWAMGAVSDSEKRRLSLGDGRRRPALPAGETMPVKHAA